MKKVFILSLVNFLLMLARRPGGLFVPTLYFEDGQTFLEQQILTENPMLMFMPFVHGALGDAYYLFLTKVITYFASVIPEFYIPYLMNGAGILIASLCSSIFVHDFFRNIIKSDILRMLFCILTAVNLDGGEFLGTTTNFFWTLGIPLLLIILCFPINFRSILITKKNLYVGFLITLIISLSTPVSGILFPFALLKLLWKKLRIFKVLHFAIVLGGVFQIIINKLYSNVSANEVLWPDFYQGVSAFYNGITYHIVLPIFFGYKFSVSSMENQNGVFIGGIILIIAFLVIARSLYVRENRAYNLIIISAILLSGFIYAVSFIKRSLWHYLFITNETFLWGGPRYYFISRVLIVIVLFWLIDRNFVNRSAKVLFASSLFGYSLFSGYVLEEKSPPENISWKNYYHYVTEWRSNVLKSQVAEVRVPIFASDAWRLLLPSNDLSVANLWTGQLDQNQVGKFVLNSEKRATSKNFMLIDGTVKKITGEFTFICDKPSPGNVVIRTFDSYGVELTTKIKFKKCGRTKAFELQLPESTRRGLNISLTYTGEGGEVQINDFQISR